MTQLTVQLPDPVLEAARKIAARERITVDELVSRMLSEVVTQDAAWEQHVARGKQISRERVLEILTKAPDVEPDPTDRIE